MRKYFLPSLLFIIFFLLTGSLYTVHETEQVIVLQFGRPIGDVITDAGLKIKIPFIQTVTRFEKRIIEWDGAANEMPTKDNKYSLLLCNFVFRYENEQENKKIMSKIMLPIRKIG